MICFCNFTLIYEVGERENWEDGTGQYFQSSLLIRVIRRTFKKILLPRPQASDLSGLELSLSTLKNIFYFKAC